MQKRKLETTGLEAPVAKGTVQPALEDDDEDDMFSDNFKSAKHQKLSVDDGKRELLSEHYDDPDGYYKVNPGDCINDTSKSSEKIQQYKVLNVLGKGVFATVVRAQPISSDSASEQAVAIKILRNNDVMLKAGQKELGFLKKIEALQKPESRNVVKLMSSFEFRGHLCLVFEALNQNLRELLYKYGKNRGLNIKAIRTYARQLFGALCALRQCGIVHADIKPDNILINEDNTKIKLADLGSASGVTENEITPYLVSRFYRAPEIILGSPYEYGIDVWSSACTIYELYTGSILFPGKTNNQMLKFMMQTKGRFPGKMLKRSQFANQHFELSDATILFIDKHPDIDNGLDYVKKYLPDVKPSMDFKTRLLSPEERVKLSTDPATLQLVQDFVDFLEHCFILNPDKRLNCFEAFNHAFLKQSSTAK